MDKFSEICQKIHSEQAIWWLNGCWENGAQEYKEEIWELAHIFMELSSGQKVLYGKRAKKIKETCDVDEMQAHRVLEKLGETLTVREMRQRLLKLDIDNNKRLCITEYLTNKYLSEEKDAVEQVVRFNQGGVDPQILQEAQDLLDAAQNDLDLALEAATAAHKALEEAKKSAKIAHDTLVSSEKAAAEAHTALVEQQAAEAQVQAALQSAQAAADALEAEEKRFNDKLARLQSKIDDPNSGTVKRNSAINKLAQMKSEDPLPLRKAKITQNAALKKVKKEKKKAAKATKKCDEAKVKADEAAAAAAEAKTQADETEAQSAEAKEAAEEAKEHAAEAFTHASEKLEEVKSMGTGVPQGKVWWMERTLEERKKFLPK